MARFVGVTFCCLILASSVFSAAVLRSEYGPPNNTPFKEYGPPERTDQLLLSPFTTRTRPASSPKSSIQHDTPRTKLGVLRTLPKKPVIVPITTKLTPIENSFIDSPLRTINSPIRTLNSPVHKVNSPVNSLIDSPARIVDSPARIVDSPVRTIVAPPNSHIQLRDDKNQYSVGFQSPDGTEVKEQGKLISTDNGWEYVIAKTGSYKYTSPEGKLVDVNWIADEKGFRILSSTV